MSGSKTYLVVTIALSLAAAALAIASQALAVIYYKDSDALFGFDTLDLNWGYFTFILSAASLASIFIIVLLIMVALGKDLHTGNGLLLLSSSMILLFGTATVLLVNLRNTRVAFDTNMNTLDSLEAVGTTSATVDNLRTH